MRNLLTFFSITVLYLTTVACRKSVDIDPRDQYVGIYSMTATINRTAGPILPYAITPTTTIVVTKDPGSKQLRLVVPANYDILATIDGPTFVIPQQTVTQAAPGQTYYQSYQGDGLFSGGYLNFNFTVNASDGQDTSKTIITLKGSKTGNI